MDILAQRKSMGNLSGYLLVNGRPATSSFIRKTAYVPQVRLHVQEQAASCAGDCARASELRGCMHACMEGPWHASEPLAARQPAHPQQN